MAHTAALETSPANHRILERSLGAARGPGPPLDIDHYKWVRGVLPRPERASRHQGRAEAQPLGRGGRAPARPPARAPRPRVRPVRRDRRLVLRRARARPQARRRRGAPRRASAPSRRAAACTRGRRRVRRRVRRHRGERRRWRCTHRARRASSRTSASSASTASAATADGERRRAPARQGHPPDRVIPARACSHGVVRPTRRQPVARRACRVARAALARHRRRFVDPGGGARGRVRAGGRGIYKTNSARTRAKATSERRSKINEIDRGARSMYTV